MGRWLLVFLLLPLLPFPAAAANGQGTVVTGGDLPGAVRLAAADEDAFFRRIDLPPRLTRPPSVSGPSYTVSSGYWDTVLRDDAGQDAAAPSSPAERDALYYPDTGHVRARQGGGDVWLLLDERQRAILDRYIRLGRAGLLVGAPGVLEVVRAAALQSEPIGVQVGPRALTPAEAASFWRLAGAATLRREAAGGPPDAGSPGVTWVILTLLEGRSLRLLYDAAGGLLFDPVSGEVYTVPERWLVPLLGEAAAAGPGFALAPAPVQQQPSRGPGLWWPFMLGGGLALLAAAWWSQRRWAA